MSQVRDATARIAVRRRGDRRRRWARWLVAGLVVAVFAAAGWVGGFSPVLAAQAVSVSGTDLLTRNEVLTGAGRAMRSRIQPASIVGRSVAGCARTEHGSSAHSAIAAHAGLRRIDGAHGARFVGGRIDAIITTLPEIVEVEPVVGRIAHAIFQPGRITRATRAIMNILPMPLA